MAVAIRGKHFDSKNARRPCQLARRHDPLLSQIATIWQSSRVIRDENAP